MEQLRKYVEAANRSWQLADHMTHTTYNTIKDPKLLLLAVTHLHTAMENCVSALVYYDYLFKRLSMLPGDYSGKFDVFKRVSMTRYNISRSIVPAMQEIKSTVEDHKSSEMEFRRKNQFVIASKNYRLRTLTIDKLKNLLAITKPLLVRTNEVTRAKERFI